MLINNALADSDIITVQEQEAPQEAPAVPESNFLSFVPMVLVVVIFYFFMFRPQEKKRKEQERLVLGVKKGEEVLTNSGIHGVVTDINDSENIVMLRVAKDTEIKILKNSIIDIVSRRKKEEKEKAKKKIAKN